MAESAARGDAVAADKRSREDKPARERGHHLLSLGTRQRVFFTYEKRIRDKSSLEKVFDYFSSREDDHGMKSMLPHDLLQAIVPTFPPSKSADIRAGYLEGEQRSLSGGAAATRRNEFFANFDIDGDGVLSYMEFLLVLTLISIPKMDVHIIFGVMDADNSGYVDAQEFDVIVKRLQAKANLGSMPSGMGRASKLLSQHASGLMNRFFGPDLKGRLSLSEFARFLEDLHTQLVKLEFEHYLPDERGMIPGVDFARSLVTAAEMMSVDELLNRVDAHSDRLASVDISFPEFESIQQMQCNLDPISVALEFMDQVGRPVTQDELVRTVKRMSGVLLSEPVAAIIMALFSNAQGNLNVPLFLDTLRRRGYFWARRGNGDALVPKNRVQRLFSCIQACNQESASP